MVYELLYIQLHAQLMCLMFSQVTVVLMVCQDSMVEMETQAEMGRKETKVCLSASVYINPNSIFNSYSARHDN